MVIALLAAASLAGGWWILRAPSSAPEMNLFTVHPGRSVRRIAHDLQQAGLLRHPSVWIVFSKLIPGRTPRPGVYEIPRGQNAWRLWQQMRRGPAPIRLTLPEGWTSYQMAQVLERQGVVPSVEFLSEVRARRGEGRLFPDTYLFDQGMGARQVADRLMARFEDQKPADWERRAKAVGLTPEQLLILASVVEREARDPRELPIIAGVFLNRLRKNWLLESCATVQHALGLQRGTPGIWKPRLLYKDLAISSPFNTYKIRGLPPEPIGNPGRSALEAVAYPAETDAMFFVADGGGTHRFSRYYKDHINAKRQRITVNGQQGTGN